MTAQSIDTFVLVFSNPEWDLSDLRLRLNSSISFDLFLGNTIQTLSTNTATNGEEIEGLLYVPDLVADDPCFNVSKQYIPQKVTRQANLPNTDYLLVALAPWISPACTKSYLAAARAARAFIFYLPNNSTATPPLPNNPVWGLNDGGTWKSKNKFPVYAVPGSVGQTVMSQLGQYSGNMTEVENGHLLSEQFDSRDYVRLYTVINTDSQTTLPSLWVFLLIVLAILLAIISLTSVLMHYVQRRHRKALRRRVMDGEVDLEALGIKRLTIPQELVNKMPLFVYVATDKDQPGNLPERQQEINNVPAQESTSPNVGALPRRNSDPLPSHLDLSDGLRLPDSSLPSPSTLQHRSLAFSQPTCPICLDDYISHSSMVRELPCGHIYHPECIDPFLKENSSLCPLCKGKILPKGYCPENVTNAMVRRERLVRRMRERVIVDVPDEESASTPARNFSIGAGRRMASFHHQFGRAARAGGSRISSAPVPSSVEMGNRAMDSDLPVFPLPSPAAVAQRLSRAERMERARRRASTFLGTLTVEDEEREQQAHLPKWRKAIGTVFPGFR